MYSKDKILLLHSLGFFVSIYSLKSVKIQFLESENKFGLFSKLPLLYFIGILLIIISIYLSFISQNKLFLTYQIFVCNLVIWWTPQLVSSYPIVNDSYAHSALIASMSSFPSKSGYYTYLNFPLFFTSNYYFLFNLTGIDFEYEMILFYYLNSCITNICLFLVIYKIQSKDISKSNKSFFTFSLFNFYSFHYTSPIAFAYPLFIFALYFNFKIFNFENHKLELDENFKFLLIIELFLLYAQPTQAVLLLILSCSNFLVIGLLNRKYKLIDFQKQADISAKKIIMITIIIITFILLIYGIFFPRNLYSIYAIIFKAHPLEFLAYTINIVNITSFHSDRIAPFIKLLVIVIQNLIIIRFLYRIIRRKIFQANVWMLSMYTGSIIFLVLDNLFFRWGNNSNRVFYIWSLLFCLIISNNENITYIKIHVKIGKTFNINTKIFKMKHFFGVCILILVVFSLQIGIYADYGRMMYSDSEINAYVFIANNELFNNTEECAILEIYKNLPTPYFILYNISDISSENNNQNILDGYSCNSKYYSSNGILNVLENKNYQNNLSRVILLSHKSEIMAKYFNIFNEFIFFRNFIINHYSLVYNNGYQFIYFSEKNFSLTIPI